MTVNALLQLALYLVVLIALVKPFGAYMANVYEGRSAANRMGAPVENLIYRLCGIEPAREMRWVEYAAAMLVFNFLGLLAVYALQRFQAHLPLNPQNLGTVSPDSSFNTAVSFEYRLLTVLIKNVGKVTTHRQLLKQVWGPSHVEHNHYLRIYMANLRHKLEADPARPRFLLTEAGVGYRLADE